MTYYYTHRSWFKEYYRVYYLKHRQEQIDKASEWNIAHPDRHAVACRKHLTKNKKTIYGKQNVKRRFKIVLRELLSYII